MDIDTPKTEKGFDECAPLALGYQSQSSQGSKVKPAAVTWIPIATRTWLVVLVCLFMFGLVAALEALGRYASDTGIHIAGIENISVKNTKWLTGTVPTLLMIPIVIYWAAFNAEIRRMQPYITAAAGDGSPERTVLLDYNSRGRLSVIFDSIRNRHWLVTLSTTACVITLLFQPLTSGVFNIEPLEIRNSKELNYTLVGRGGDGTLRGYHRAASYLQTVYAFKWPTEVFVDEGWSLPSVNIERITDKESDIVTLEGVEAVKSMVTCNAVPGSYELNRLSAQYSDCQAAETFERDQELQVGIGSPSNECLGWTVSNLPEESLVYFWAAITDHNSGETTSTFVFCNPTTEVRTIQLRRALSSVVWVGPGDIVNGTETLFSPNGRSHNGLTWGSTNVAFDQTTTAIKDNVAQAIKSYIIEDSQDPSHHISSLQNLASMTEKVTEIYTYYLAMAGDTYYFLDDTNSTAAIILTVETRFIVQQAIMHTLAALITFIAIFMLVLHAIHVRQRRAFKLYGPIGSIASIVALVQTEDLAHVHRQHSEEELRRSFDGMKFEINPQTQKVAAVRGTV